MDEVEGALLVELAGAEHQFIHSFTWSVELSVMFEEEAEASTTFSFGVVNDSDFRTFRIVLLPIISCYSLAD